LILSLLCFFFFQAEDGIRDRNVTGVQTCALPILLLVNHAYFLERVQDDKAFAANKILVFDEAQKLMLNVEHFSRRQLNVTQLVTLLEKHLTAKLPVLENRLIENLSFKLCHIETRFYPYLDNFDSY